MPLGNAQNTPVAVLVNANGCQDGHILDLTAPGAFEHDAIQIHIGEVALDLLAAPALDVLVDLLVERLETVPEETRVLWQFSRDSARTTKLITVFISLVPV